MSVGALLVAAALLAANAFFVGAEFAMLAARRSKISQLASSGDRRASHALAGLRELSLMLAGAQLGITMASLGLGAVAEPALHHGLEVLLGRIGLPHALTYGLALAIALAIVSFLHMVVGEMAPKSWAVSHPERSALALARPFRVFALVFRPFLHLLNTMANGVVRACGVTPQDELALAHSPADLALLLEESAQHGMLPAEQHRILTRAIELSGLDAKATMIPRSDIIAIPADAGIDQLERLASGSGRSRLPVYDDDLDRIRGIVHVKDVLAVDDRQRSNVSAATLARPAMVVPESRALEDLMIDMRQQRQHVAVVIDEYGTVTGLVALEDLLEELIGEFEDESDRRDADVRRRDGAVLLAGSTRPDELEAATGLALPEGQWETLAGFVMAELGRVPEVGDAVGVGKARLEVTAMKGHRVIQLAVATGPRR